MSLKITDHKKATSTAILFYYQKACYRKREPLDEPDHEHNISK